jgi:ferredoxin
VTVTNDPDAAWDGARGHVTKDLLTELVPDLARGPVMLCGPDAMMTAMRALLVDLGVPDREIHQEAFISTPPIEPGAPEPEVELPVGVATNIQFMRSGKMIESTQLTVLEAADECGVTLPYECRAGICGQCKTKLVSGKVAMEVQDALTSSDRAKGFILACQARAAKDIVIDA